MKFHKGNAVARVVVFVAAPDAAAVAILIADVLHTANCIKMKAAAADWLFKALKLKIKLK